MSESPASVPPEPKTEAEPRVPAMAPPESLWARIREHKVLQWSLAYLGAALAFAHAQDLVGHAFNWPEVTGRITIGVLAVGFPIAVALAWYHGYKGMTRIGAGEMYIIAVLLVIGAGLLMALVRAPQERSAETTAAISVQPSASAPAAGVSGPSAAASTSHKPRLAILPFDNLSPDPANAFFTDGLHEEILATLAQRAPGLEVISRTTMMMYRLHPESLRMMASELGATHVIEGSVRRDGRRVRLTLQLIDARTDDHLWAQDYDRTLSNALTLQSEVASKVASELSVQLTPRGTEAGALIRNPEAYDQYLKAIGLRAAILSGQSAVRAPSGSGDIASGLHMLEDLFSRAIDLDPTLAPAYAERFAPRLRASMVFDARDDAARLAREDLEAAERLAPGDPKVIAARAWYLEYVDVDWQGALQKFTEAESAGLSDPAWLADKSVALIALNKEPEAIALLQRLLALDPRNGLIITYLGPIQAAYHQPGEAVRLLNIGIQELPEAADLRLQKANIIFAFTGNLSALDTLAVGPEEPSAALSSLRYHHRYAELKDLLARSHDPLIADGSMLGEVLLPVARCHGWASLLLGDKSAAAHDGRELLDFVSRQRETKWNRAYLQMLKSDGYTLSGQREPAIAAGREAVALVSDSTNPYPLTRIDVTLEIAANYAWNGAQEQAVNLLEALSKSTPGPGPARIARDPLFTVPLAQNAHYQQLVSGLESQMRQSRLQ